MSLTHCWSAPQTLKKKQSYMCTSETMIAYNIKIHVHTGIVQYVYY